MKMRLTIDVEYADVGLSKPEKTARTLLEHVATHAANRGLFTGNTPLQTRGWSHRVERLPDEQPEVPDGE